MLWILALNANASAPVEPAEPTPTLSWLAPDGERCAVSQIVLGVEPRRTVVQNFDASCSWAGWMHPADASGRRLVVLTDGTGKRTNLLWKGSVVERVPDPPGSADVRPRGEELWAYDETTAGIPEAIDENNILTYEGKTYAAPEWNDDRRQACIVSAYRLDGKTWTLQERMRSDCAWDLARGESILKGGSDGLGPRRYPYRHFGPWEPDTPVVFATPTAQVTHLVVLDEHDKAEPKPITPLTIDGEVVIPASAKSGTDLAVRLTAVGPWLLAFTPNPDQPYDEPKQAFVFDLRTREAVWKARPVHQVELTE